MMVLDHKHQAFAEGCRRAADRLAAVDLASRCAALGLPVPEAGRIGPFRWFDREVVLTVADGTLDGECTDLDRLILLHALTGGGVARDSGRWTTFRSFPGGAFYWEPYQRRCLAPLAQVLRGCDDLLGRLAGFAHRPLAAPGDVAVRLAAFGRVGLGLCYHAADEEFPASVDVLFDPSLTGILCAEDALGLVGILATRIHSHPCATCAACGLCV